MDQQTQCPNCGGYKVNSETHYIGVDGKPLIQNPESVSYIAVVIGLLGAAVFLVGIFYFLLVVQNLFFSIFPNMPKMIYPQQLAACSLVSFYWRALLYTIAGRSQKRFNVTISTPASSVVTDGGQHPANPPHQPQSAPNWSLVVNRSLSANAG